MRKIVSLFSILCFTLVLSACPPVEQVGRDAVAFSKGYLDSAKGNHPECATGTQSTDCTVIAKGVAAKDTLIDAIHVYCAMPEWKEGDPVVSCNPQAGAKDKLKQAISGLNQTMKDVKKLGSKP